MNSLSRFKAQITRQEHRLARRFNYAPKDIAMSFNDSFFVRRLLDKSIPSWGPWQEISEPEYYRTRNEPHRVSAPAGSTSATLKRIDSLLTGITKNNFGLSRRLY